MRGCRSATHPLLSAGLLLGGRRVQRSRYRPDPRRLPETLTTLAGVGAGALLFATAAVDPANLYPSLSPLEWPQLALLPVLAVAPRGRAGPADPAAAHRGTAEAPAASLPR